MVQHFRIGEILDSDTNDANSGDTIQFVGLVSNINFYFSPLEKSVGLCEKNYIKPDIVWSLMEWSHIGESLEIIDLNEDQICTTRSYEAITLPLLYNFDTAVKTCNYLGNGLITSYQNPGNLSDIKFFNLYGNNYKVCK